MKTYDLGLVAGALVLILALTSVFLHKHTNECAIECRDVENIAEFTIDKILKVPDGTSERIINSMGE